MTVISRAITLQVKDRDKVMERYKSDQWNKSVSLGNSAAGHHERLGDPAHISR